MKLKRPKSTCLLIFVISLSSLLNGQNDTSKDTTAFIEKFINRIYDVSLAEGRRDSLYLIHFQLLPRLKAKKRFKDYIHVMNSLVGIYLEDGVYEKCPPILAEMKQINSQTDEPFINLITHLSHSQYLNFTNEIDSSLYYKSQALEIAKADKDTFHHVLIASQIISTLLSNDREDDKLLEFIQESLDLASKFNPNEVLLRGLYFERAHFFFKKGRYEAAIRDINRSLEFYENRLSADLYDIKSLLSKSFAALGNYTKAYSIQEEALEMNSVIYNRRRSSRVQGLMQQLEQEKQQRMIGQFQAQQEFAAVQKRQRERIILILIFVFLGVVSSLILIIRQYKKRRKSDSELLKLQAEMSDEKAKFYTNITHEFRTPLTVILGLSKRIRQPAEIKDIIWRNAQNVLVLVDQLLDISKADASQLTLKLVLADMARFIDYLTESFYSTAQEKDIRLVSICNENEIWMDFDTEKISQIHYNLISNAIKFTPPGGKIIVQIWTENDELIWKTADTGCGIPASDLEKVFDRFYQAPNPGLNYVEGTGIGLSYVKELIRLMNGAYNFKK